MKRLWWLVLALLLVSGTTKADEAYLEEFAQRWEVPVQAVKDNMAAIQEQHVIDQIQKTDRARTLDGVLQRHWTGGGLECVTRSIESDGVYVPCPVAGVNEGHAAQPPPDQLARYDAPGYNQRSGCKPWDWYNGAGTYTDATRTVRCLPYLGFWNDLQTTLVPDYARGSSTPTFTRNSTPASDAYQTDFEGKLNLVLKNEARFQGARRVRNLVALSENITWVLGGTSAPTESKGSYGGKSNVSAIVFPTGATNYAASNALGAVGAAVVSGRSYTLRVTLAFSRALVADEKITAFDANNTTPVGVNFTASLQPGTTLATYTSGVTAPTSSNAIKVAVAVGTKALGAGDALTAPLTVYVTEWQVEEVTGQTNQNPSEYVSVGVESAPFHGAGVDGVAYKSTLPANTVSSNVVTEATGAAIDSSQGAAAGGVTAGVVDATGPVGYLAEGQRENVGLQSQTFATTWARTGVDAVTEDQYIAPDGTTTADKLTATAGVSVHTLELAGAPWSYTWTATPYTVSWYVRYVNHRWIFLDATDTISTFGISVDLLNGVLGTAAAGTTATIAATALSNVYRVTFTFTPTANAAGIGISFNNADSASRVSWDAAGTELVGVWGAQVEAASFASTYIPTTTGAVTRAADSLIYAVSGNVGSTAGTAYAEVTFNGSGEAERIIDANNGGAFGTLMAVLANDSLYLSDGAANRTFGLTLTRPNATVVKLATVYSGSTTNAAKDGTLGTATTFDGDISPSTQLGIGGQPGGAGQLFGTIRNVRIWLGPLSTTEMEHRTAFLNGVIDLSDSRNMLAANDEYYRKVANR